MRNLKSVERRVAKLEAATPRLAPGMMSREELQALSDADLKRLIAEKEDALAITLARIAELEGEMAPT